MYSDRASEYVRSRYVGRPLKVIKVQKEIAKAYMAAELSAEALEEETFLCHTIIIIDSKTSCGMSTSRPGWSISGKASNTIVALSEFSSSLKS